MKRLDRTLVSSTMLPSFLLLAALAGCSDREKETRSVARPVNVIRVEDRELRKNMSFAGEIKARHEATLSFRVAGKLIARPVEVGDSVRKGQPLARLDAGDYRLAVQALKAQLKSAVAERDFARDDLARYRELLGQKVISPPEFDRHQTAYTAARERVAALEAQLGQAANQLDYTELLADRDGVVTALEAETGQVVAAGQPVVKLARLDEKEIHFDIPEHRIAGLKLHQDVGATLWADSERRIKARIREIAAAADPATRTYRVKAALLEGRDDARLGMTATVRIPSNAPPRIAVPLSAVFTSQSEPGQPRVWLVDEPSGTVRSVPVRVGEALDGERVAVAGLASGQLIVSAGVQRLMEGQGVRLPEDVSPVPRGKGSELAGGQP
jgi:multidrug efflux system membrane fusion protein